MKTTLRTKFLIPTIILVVLGIIISSIATHVISENAIQGVIKSQLLHTADSAQQHLESWIKINKMRIRHWSEEDYFKISVRDTFMGKSSRKAANLFLKKKKQRSPFFESVNLLNKKGEIVASSDFEETGNRNYLENQFFRASIQGRDYISEIHKHPLSGKPLLFVSSPVYADDEIKGVLFGIANMDYFTGKYIRPIKVGEKGHVYITDSSGIIIAHSDETKYLSGETRCERFDKVNTKSKDIIIHYFRGKKEIFAFRNETITGSVIIAVATIDDIMLPVTVIAKWNLLIAVLFIGFFIIIITLVVNSIVKPISELKKGSKIVGDGNLDYKIEVLTQDEIGELALEFNEMLKKLKLALSDLKESQTRSYALLKGVPVSTVVWRKKGNNFILEDYNDAALSLTNGNIEKFKGIKASKMLSHRPEMFEHISRCFAEKESLNLETLYEMKTTGENKYFSFKFAFVPPDFVLVHSDDITKQKELEKILEKERMSLAQKVEERTRELTLANAELERASRLKDEFLANMSHELRTPLNSILGMSEALQEEIYGPMNKQQLNSLYTVEKSGRHLLQLISDILDLSKIEAGKIEFQISEVCVETIIRDSLNMIKQIGIKKNIRINSVIDTCVTIIKADNLRLKQILVNLLINAVKFTPGGGSVGLEVMGEPEKNSVQFIVWDTGIGIAEKDIELLFKPFTQLDAGLSRKNEGTGLGLSLVARLAEMHGGGVSVKSRKDKGSRFTVTLPWDFSEQLTVSSKQGGEVIMAGGKDERISNPEQNLPVTLLLAEDNMTNSETLSDYLQAKGYRVIIAYEGAEAVQKYRQEQLDVILMDIQMPGMDGLEAIQQIRRHESELETDRTPIIALTALVMPGDREKCLESGADDYMSKPVNMKMLTEMINRYA
ncbi:response regulator [Desulfobacterales bacterium HSG17]|nr:response regulator [Desulfobacterales bacterium HSG17]